MVTIKLVILGHLPLKLNVHNLLSHKSKLFKFDNDVSYIAINKNSDTAFWQFSDQVLEEQLPANNGNDVVLAITKVPLQHNYYTRILTNNRVCISYHEVADFLSSNNIKLENFILRMAYSVTIMYEAFGQSPTFEQALEIVHDETRGCIFDMDGIKSEIVYSTNCPTICDRCCIALQDKKVAINNINQAKDELKKIKKSRYYLIADYIKAHPGRSLAISAGIAIVLGIISSLIANMIQNTLDKC